jgi:two-component sensor histidine kinase
MMQIDEGYAALHGLPGGTVETTTGEWRARAHPDDVARVAEMREQAFGKGLGEYAIEYRILRSGGELRWIESRSFITYTGEGRPHRVTGVNIDITGRKRAEEHQRMLVAELDHRVKNALATVSAVTSRTHDASGSAADFVAALDGRIKSMAATHQLLSSNEWKGIFLSDLVRRELAPYAAHSNTEIDGPDVILKAEPAQALSMVLHELTTNAAKYGALSTRGGRISVRWHHVMNGNADARLCIEWQESGGPAVAAPDRSGYGMEVIRDLLPYELDSKVDLSFASAGVRCCIDIPVSQLASG